MLRVKAKRFNASGRAVRQDQLMPVGTGTQMNVNKKTKEKWGGSAWRKWTPESIQRAAFDKGTVRVTQQSFRDSLGAASSGSIGHTNVIFSKSAAAKSIMDGTSEGIHQVFAKSLLCAHDFWITNHVFDETKLFYSVQGKGYRNFSTLAHHSQVTWSDELGVHDEDVIRTPKTLERYTASVQFGVLSDNGAASGILPQEGARPLARFYGTLHISDSHAVNKLTSKYVRQVMPAQDLLLPTWCLQHSVGTTCTELVTYLNLLSRVWTLAKTFTQGDFHGGIIKHLRDVMESEETGLEVVDPDSFVLDSGDLDEDFTDSIMDRCYRSRTHTAPGQDADEAEETKRNINRQRKKAEFSSFFPKGWNRSRPLHLCPVGCCGPTPCHDRNMSVEKACKLVQEVLLENMILPALNKWTKMEPAMCQALLIVCFFKLIKHVLEARCHTTYENLTASPQEEERATDAAQPDQESFQGMLKRFGKRCLVFVGAEETRSYGLIWSVIGEVLMALHYHFFKHSSWLSHSKRNVQRLSVLEFCPNRLGQVGSSCASRALDNIAALLFEPNGQQAKQFIEPLVQSFRSPIHWTADLLQKFQKCTIMSFCLLWRHLVHKFLCYPWAVAVVFDPDVARDRKLPAADKFWNALSCAWDDGVGKVLRHILCDHIEDMFDPGLQKFVWAMFERAMVTSTVVEMMFAPLSQYTTKAKTRYSASSLQALHVTDTFKHQVKKWWKTLETDAPPGFAASGKHRDPIAQTMKAQRPGTNTCGWHLYSKGSRDFASIGGSRDDFCDLPLHDQEPYHRQAADIRRQASRAPGATDLVLKHMEQDVTSGGPWNLSARRGKYPGDWPLHPDRICTKEISLLKAHKSWKHENEVVTNGGNTQHVIRYSLFVIRYSLFVMRYSLFVILGEG